MMEVFCATCCGEVEPHISCRQLGALGLTYRRNYIPGRTNAHYTNSGSAPVKQVFWAELRKPMHLQHEHSWPAEPTQRGWYSKSSQEVFEDKPVSRVDGVLIKCSSCRRSIIVCSLIKIGMCGVMFFCVSSMTSAGDRPEMFRRNKCSTDREHSRRFGGGKHQTLVERFTDSTEVERATRDGSSSMCFLFHMRVRVLPR